MVFLMLVFKSGRVILVEVQ